MKIADETVIIGKRAMTRSYAKINLTLDVLGRMENGYHSIETIMQTVGLFDLIITDAAERGIKVSTNLKYLPNNYKNIAYKAAELFFSESGIKGGAKILIHKNIPVAAGLAGGSGNAAAVLISLNLLYRKPFSDNGLLKLGARLGADVPFCMECGTKICRGIGDEMEDVAPMKHTHVLIVKPPVNISTAEIYEKIDSVSLSEHPKSSELAAVLNDGSFRPELMFNVMGEVSEKMHPVIGGIRKKMMMNGACAAMMSGSGSAVFGIFDDYKKAKKSADSFSYFYKEVYLTMTN